jgi:hypothetical protein
MARPVIRCQVWCGRVGDDPSPAHASAGGFIYLVRQCAYLVRQCAMSDTASPWLAARNSADDGARAGDPRLEIVRRFALVPSQPDTNGGKRQAVRRETDAQPRGRKGSLTSYLYVEPKFDHVTFGQCDY